ncbi:hypothetical protein E2K93_04945 [Thalassotalea sp. HSM 43]|uniref:hypothetical protein n=1 Tax=Thalassotalea sp. HSM 43 TaxID=2552945 RepID=UPI0010817888|nr:hypothetical protein [Thalassotalea sp. HSM 43]QBY03765.1 hypothetical protein E2K93_04945 [Thalassotalea sp. HSM 43]
MSKKFSFSVLASSILLMSCGGGGGSKDIENKPLPVPVTFNLQAKVINDCGSESPFTNVELILQDENWQVISRHEPDAQGAFAVDVINQRINYTLVANYQQGEDDEGIEAVSFHQVDADVAATYYATHAGQTNNENCQCNSQDLTLNHPRIDALTQANSSAEFSDIEVISGTSTMFKGVEVCRDSSQPWATHSFTVQGTDNNGNLVALGGFGTGLEDVNAFESAAMIQISSSNPELYTDQVFNGVRHFAITVEEDAGEVLIFDNHEYSAESVYSGNAQIVFDDTSSIFGNVSVYSEHSIYSDNYNDALDLKPSKNEPDIDLDRLTEIQDDGLYDYGSVNNHEMAVFTFVYRAKDPQTELDMPARWKIYAPIAGSLPIIDGLPGYQDIIGTDTSIKGTFVDLIRSYDSGDYDDYVDYYATGKDALEEQHVNDSFASERHFYHIGIELK